MAAAPREPSAVTPRGPLVLVVIDGYGIAPPGPGNAVHLARTPHLDALAAEGIGDEHRRGGACRWGCPTASRATARSAT